MSVCSIYARRLYKDLYSLYLRIICRTWKTTALTRGLQGYLSRELNLTKYKIDTLFCGFVQGRLGRSLRSCCFGRYRDTVLFSNDGSAACQVFQLRHLCPTFWSGPPELLLCCFVVALRPRSCCENRPPYVLCTVGVFLKQPRMKGRWETVCLTDADISSHFWESIRS